ncbi:MAG TPA: DUF4270 family protein, partial [Bacteroidia bacterium]|nr:DUF4270 family protein [Bacteroidia bacterium]
MNRGKWLLAMGFCLAAILNSCREDTGSTGANILPPNDQISAYETDTTSVLTSMFLKDSIITDDTVYSGLGSYNDPIFGQYKSSIYAQIFSPVGATTTTIPWANDSVPVDSVVLILPYITGVATSYYGNLDPQTIVVDTLESPIHATNSAGNYVAYYSDTSIKYDAAHPIGMQQIVPLNPYYGHDTAVRVKLKKGWWQSIMNRITNNPNYYTTFDSLVKGLYITVSNSLQLPGQGGILFIYLNQGSFACIDFYYHDKSTPTIPYYVQFPIGGTFFSHIDRSYVTAPFANIHPSGKHDSIPANNLMYVQGAGGVEGRVNFPNLYKNWQGKKNILINKAEVDFT